jgi:hypothetical protein
VFNWIRKSKKRRHKETTTMPTLPQDQIFPAAPGYSILRFAYLDRKVTVEFARSNLQVLPVIGWRIIDGVVLPIGLGDMQPDNCADAILAPSGMVYTVDGRSWRGLDAYAVDLAASWKAWRAEHYPQPAPPPPTEWERALEGAVLTR